MNRHIGDTTWEKWKRHRKKTLACYIGIGVVVGIDYSVIFSTLYLYLRDTVKTDNSEVFYGLTIAAYSISSGVFGLVAGRWLDKTRRVKLYTNLILLMQIVGLVLYLVPYHVAFQVVGRFIAGSGDPFISICTGEVVRIYDEKQSTRAIWWLASCYSIGLIIGPILPLIFKGVGFQVGPLLVNEFNFIGIFMVLLLVVTIVIVNFFMYDCSKEIDLKEYLKESGTNASKEPGNQFVVEKDIINACTDDDTTGSDERLILHEPASKVADVSDDHGNETQYTSNEMHDQARVAKIKNLPTLKLTLRKLMSDVDVVLLLTSTFICMYAMFSVDVIVPLIIVVLLSWDLNSLVIFLVTSGIVYALILFLLSKLCNTSVSLYNMMIVCLVCGVLMFSIIACIKITDRNFVWDCVLVLLLGIFWLLLTCTEECIIRAILAKKVPSTVQSFTEALRNGISGVATIFAAVSAPLVLPFIEWWSVMGMIVLGVILVMYIMRRKSLVFANEIDFYGDSSNSCDIA